MANPVVTHTAVTGAAANSNVLVDGPKWDAVHTVTGLENVDNTSDANKPVSTATQTALNLKANLASPTLTGTPAAPTATLGTNTTQIATTAFAIANAGVSSIAGNIGAFTLANGIDNSTNQIQLTAARRTLPTTQVFLSGSGTYTTPANVLWVEVELVGGGGGGAGSGTTPGNGGAGGSTTFSSLTGSGGGGATANVGGTGGAAANGYVNKAGAAGGNGSGLAPTAGGFGANSPYGGAGVGGAPGAGAGIAAAANTGSGGGGGGVNATVNGGGGGGAGGFVRSLFAPGASHAYTVGAGGTAGTTGTSGAAGGAGGSGSIQVIEHYGT